VIVFDGRQLGIRECLVINDLCRESPRTRVVVLGTARSPEPPERAASPGGITALAWPRATEVLCRLVRDLRAVQPDAASSSVPALPKRR
jgi:hypothetical protein